MYEMAIMNFDLTIIIILLTQDSNLDLMGWLR